MLLGHVLAGEVDIKAHGVERGMTKNKLQAEGVPAVLDVLNSESAAEVVWSYRNAFNPRSLTISFDQSLNVASMEASAISPQKEDCFVRRPANLKIPDANEN